MGFSWVILLEAVAFAWALSLDAFVASFSYASKGIKIPLRSAWVINLVCAGITGLSLFAGSMLRQYIPPGFAVAVSFTLLLILGVAKLLDNITKAIIRRSRTIQKKIQFSLLNFQFILMLYANPEQADIDGSKILSPAEALSLALALSLDGIAVGLGAAIGHVNGPAVFASSLVIGMSALLLGGFAGNKAAQKAPFDLSWLSGILLIGLAVAKLW